MTGGPKVRITEAGGALVAVVGVAVVAAIVLSAAGLRVAADARASADAAARDRARVDAENVLEQVVDLLIGADVQSARWRHGLDLVALATAVPTDIDVTVKVGGPGPVLELDIDTGVSDVGLSARLRRLASIDYAWFIDLDVLDPVLNGSARADCTSPLRYGPRPSSCLRIPLRNLVIDGPVHANDALRVVETSFQSVVSTAHSFPGDGSDLETSLVPSARPPGASPFTVRGTAPLALPHRHDEGLATQPPTCRFAGPTLIRFDGSNVRVWSPLTAASAAAVGGQSGPQLGCGDVSLLSFSSPTTVQLPPEAVIEVVHAVGVPCGVHPLGLTPREERGRDWTCWGGDAFVWGRYRGARSVLAEGNIQVVWDVEPGTSAQADDIWDSTALLGLVAADSIVIRRLVGPSIRRIAPLGLDLAVGGPDLPPFGAYPLDAPVSSPTRWVAPRIVASLAALGGSVSVQNAMLGERSSEPVTIYGSIAQRYRGITGWDPADTLAGNGAWTGYGLELIYDERLRTSTPPAMPGLGGHAIRILDVRHR